MKKFMIGAMALVMSMAMVACGGGDAEAELKKAEEDLEKMLEEAGADEESSQPEETKVEVSAEMADFIAPFNGTAEAVMASLEKYGANQEIVDHDMGFYNLEDPKVTGQDGNCYSLTCKSGMVENYYTVCWENGKITSITETM